MNPTLVDRPRPRRGELPCAHRAATSDAFPDADATLTCILILGHEGPHYHQWQITERPAKLDLEERF